MLAEIYRMFRISGMHEYRAPAMSLGHKTPIYMHRFGSCSFSKGVGSGLTGKQCMLYISHVWNLRLHLIFNSLCLLDPPLHLTIYLEIVWRYSSSHTCVHPSSTPCWNFKPGVLSWSSKWTLQHSFTLITATSSDTIPSSGRLMSVVQVSSITACHSLTLTAFLTSLIVSLHCLLFEGVQHLHCKNGIVIMT